MDSSKAATVSKDALRHAGDYRHHAERDKDERLDRKDGTGRGHELEKKGGAGKANWGSVTDQMEGGVTEEELDVGPDVVSPRDFVNNDDVLTLEEYEKRKEVLKD